MSRWAVVALAVVLPGLAACSAEDDREWTLGLDSQPALAVVENDRAYVSTAGGSRFPPQIYLIDSSTGDEIEHRTATGQPYDMLVAPDGRLWVAGDRHPDQSGGAGVNVHDPESLLVVAHTDVPGQAFALAQVGDDIWVGSDRAVFVLDPVTLDLERTFPIGGPAYRLIEVPDAGVLAVEGDRLELISPDGTVSASQTVETVGHLVATANATSIWVRAQVSTDSTVLTLDPALSTPAQPVGIETDSAGGGLLATAAGDVLLVDDRRDEVRCLPGGVPPAVTVPADDLVGVLAELPHGRLLFASSSGLGVRKITC